MKNNLPCTYFPDPYLLKRANALLSCKLLVVVAYLRYRTVSALVLRTRESWKDMLGRVTT